MRRGALAGFALAALVLPASAAVARPSGGNPVALVTAETENQLIAVSFSPKQVLRRVTLPADPQNVVANQKVALVVSPASGAVSILDARSLRIRKVLRGLGAPHLAALDPSGKWAFVTDDPRGQLDVVSLTRLRIAKRLFVGLGAHHLSLSPGGRRLWIALGEQAREIAIVDVSKPGHPRLLRRFDPGFEAHDLSFSPDGRRVWVTSSQDRLVRVIDARSGRRLFSVSAGPPPQHVAFGVAPANAYVTSGYGSRIESVDPDDGHVLRVRRVPYGSFNLASSGSFMITVSLLEGTVTKLGPKLAGSQSFKVAPATRGVATVVWP
jgi:DNA-binding beta-propeller fold protein YncE